MQEALITTDRIQLGNWSERSACDQWSNLDRPLFLVINLLTLTLATVVNIPEGVVVGFRNFAWAPNSPK